MAFADLIQKMAQNNLDVVNQQPISAQPLTVEQLYQNILNRTPDAGELESWKNAVGETVDPTEESGFRYAAVPELVKNAYKNVLGREAEQGGLDYWTQQVRSGALTPENLTQSVAYGAQGLDRLAAQKYLGWDMWAPEDYLKGTSGQGYQDVTNYLSSNIQDPVKVAQYARQYGIDPTEIYQAQQALKQPNAMELSGIESLLASGQSGFEPRYQQLVSSVFGSAEDLAALEKSMGLNPGDLNKTFASSQYATKSLEDIEKALQSSEANKYQEAQRFVNAAQDLYGFDAAKAQSLGQNLIQGKEQDAGLNKIYQEALTKGFTPEIQNKLLSDAAIKAPNSPYFQANPNALKIYRPLGDLKTSENNQAGQYGYVNNAPILSASEADRLLAGDVYKGGQQDFNYFEHAPGDKDRKLGWDLGSKYASSIANGAGVFGVTNNKQDINEFDRIEKQIAKGGGIQTVNYGEGPVQVARIEMTDPETGRVYMGEKPVESLFTAYDEYGSQSRSYQDYQKTKIALEKGASQLGIDASKYSSIKDLYNAVNDKTKDLYIVTGRANRWDPTVAKEQGITGVGQSRGGINHATVLYKKVNDKLVPIETLKTFNFDDPNTSRGVLGDIATGIGSILSIPPIQLALAMYGGLPNLFANMAGIEGGAAGLASLAGSSTSNALGLGLGKAGEQVLGNALLNAGTSGIMTGLTTGDLGKAGTSALAGGIGAGIAGGLPLLDSVKNLNLPSGALKLGSEILGGAAATKITGQDPKRYAVNRLLSAGFGALSGMAADKAGIPTKGPGANLAKAILPIVISKKVNPQDLVRLASALKTYQTKG